jgi:uncharacterized BrkB/YihY/UPF0761 family membrane protein
MHGIMEERLCSAYGGLVGVFIPLLWKFLSVVFMQGLYVMYTYMIKQRRKVLGPSSRRDSKGTKHN